MKQLKISHKLTNRENESFKQYLKEISDIKIFETPEEEYAVAERASLGDRKAIEGMWPKKPKKKKTDEVNSKK